VKFIPPDKLLKQLQNHLQGSSSVNVAVAWISDSPALEAFLYAAGKLKIKVQIVTGVGGYLTHPDTLERVASVVPLKIYGNAGGPLFHPKLYVFKRDFRSTVWVGSANLTGSAFSINAETVVEIDDSLDVALQEFLRFWNSSLAIPFSSFDTAKYRLEREALFRDSADKSASSLMPADALMDPTPESDPLRAGWQKYLTELRAVRGGDPLDAWLKVLDEGKTFVSR
jgi:phosphatidylserine/phosphatidylglycerophosphate/cardiolipin synthase-like enzyme